MTGHSGDRGESPGPGPGWGWGWERARREYVRDSLDTIARPVDSQMREMERWPPSLADMLAEMYG